MQILLPSMVIWQNVKFLAIQKWQMVAILKIIFGYIWTIYCPINVKFGVKKQNHAQTQVM